MSLLRRFARPRCTASHIQAARVLFYSSKTDSRAANVLADRDPLEEDPRLLKYKERLAEVYKSANTYRQKYETATHRSSDQERELVHLRETARLAQQEREDAFSRLRELDGSGNDGPAKDSVPREDPKVARYRQRLLETHKISNTHRQKYETAITRLAQHHQELLNIRKDVQISRHELEDISQQLKALHTARQGAEELIGQRVAAPSPISTVESTTDNDRIIREGQNPARDALEELEKLQQCVKAAQVERNALREELSQMKRDTLTVQKERDEFRLRLQELEISRRSSKDWAEQQKDTNGQSSQLEALQAALGTAHEDRHDALAKLQNLELVHREVEALREQRDDARDQIAELKEVQKDVHGLLEERDEHMRQIVQLEHHKEMVKKTWKARVDRQRGEDVRKVESLERRNEEIEAHWKAQLEAERSSAAGWVAELQEIQKTIDSVREEFDEALHNVSMADQEHAKAEAERKAQLEARAKGARERKAELQVLQGGVASVREGLDEVLQNISASKSVSDLDAEWRAQLDTARDAVIRTTTKLQTVQQKVESINDERDQALQKIQSLERSAEDNQRNFRKEREEARTKAAELEKLQAAAKSVLEERSKALLKAENLENKFAEYQTSFKAELEKERQQVQLKTEELEKARLETRVKAAEMQGLQKNADSLLNDRNRVQNIADRLDKGLRDTQFSIKGQLTKARREAQEEIQPIRTKNEDLGQLVHKLEALLAKKAEESRDLRNECIRQDLNVIQRMLPSMPEPVFTTESSTPVDAATRLSNWLSELEGNVADSSIRAQSLTKHNNIVRDPDVMSIYTDGALFTKRMMGSAAVVPNFGYARLQQGVVEDEFTPAKSGMTELDGIMLALESAAELAQARQRIVIFTDYDDFAQHNAATTWLGPLCRGSTLKRAVKALHQLEKKRTQIRICWIARNCVTGARLAHQAARMAGSMRNAFEAPLVLSDEKWFEAMSLRSIDEAREAAYLSDVG